MLQVFSIGVCALAHTNRSSSFAGNGADHGNRWVKPLVDTPLRRAALVTSVGRFGVFKRDLMNCVARR